MSIKQYNGYDIKPHREIPTSYIVVTSGKGGKIPDILSGLFTSPLVAMKIIDDYLAAKQKKEITNDKAGNQG